jgi:hypothetical protein
MEIEQQLDRFDTRLHRFRQLVVTGIWIAYLLPGVVAGVVGLVTNDLAAKATALGWPFIGGSLIFVGISSYDNSSAQRLMRLSSRRFRYWTFARSWGISAFACGACFMIAIPFGHDYWRSHTFIEELPYWIAFLAIVTCLVSVLIKGLVTSNGESLTIFGFLHRSKVNISEVIGVEVNWKGRLLRRSRVELRTADRLVPIPGLQFFIEGPMKLRLSRRFAGLSITSSPWSHRPRVRRSQTRHRLRVRSLYHSNRKLHRPDQRLQCAEYLQLKESRRLLVSETRREPQRARPRE